MNDDLPTQRVSADESATVRLPNVSHGVVFQRYELQRKLAAGGMGEVWLARDTVQGTDAALKFLKEDFATDAQAVTELKQEVLNSLKLNHQNILRVYRFEVDETTPQLSRRYAISMEFIRGMNLRDLRRERKIDYFEVSEISDWVLQMCEAIHYAHERKLVHRDIKPANLMLDEHGAIKVCDFGIGRTVTETSSGRTQNNAGTIPYMSRQQREFYKASPADDIYSIGATIYDLLTGHPPRYQGKQVVIPFDESPPPMADWRQRAGAKGKATSIPAHWEKVIAACLNDNPAARPASAKAVRDLLEGRADAATLASASKSAAGATSVAWGKILAGIAVVAALAGAGAYYYWAENIRILPEVQQLVTAGQVSVDEGAMLNSTLRAGESFEKQLATRLTSGVLDASTWREYSTLVAPKSEVQAKLRPLLAQGAIKEEEYNILTKDISSPDDNPYKALAKQLVLERTLTSEKWRDARAKILDPSVQQVKLLVGSGVLTASEGETLIADHRKANASNETALAKRLLQENTLTVDQWRKERFPEVPGKVDLIAERLKPLLAADEFSPAESEWLYAALSGQKNETEKSLVEHLLQKDITPGIWRARNAIDYRLPGDAVIDPANLPPAIDLVLSDASKIRLLRLNPGSFLRGSARDELGRRPNEQPQERATVAKAFYMATSETTQAQFMSVMPRNPSYWRNNPTWPVDQVDWNSIAGNNGFLARLNIGLGTKHGSQLVADLPTEDEWEYACRAGTQTSFNSGSNISNTDSDPALDQVANYNRAANGSPRPVGSFQPNAWGIYDMHGNVAEWCKNRFIRGGSWQSKAANCRVTSRNQGSAEALGSNQVGFRLVLRLKERETTR